MRASLHFVTHRRSHVIMLCEAKHVRLSFPHQEPEQTCHGENLRRLQSGGLSLIKIYIFQYIYYRQNVLGLTINPT